MTKFLTATTAASLAVRYAAFSQAADNCDGDEIGDAARRLKEIQNNTGVVVLSEGAIDGLVDRVAEVARIREWRSRLND